MKLLRRGHDKKVDLKIYIVTYKRNDILNDTLEKLFDSDVDLAGNVEINVINNHTAFSLNPVFLGKVNVLHNVLRPDWSNGNLAENWNQALIDGFRDLRNPATPQVVTLQNDTSLHPKWFSHLSQMHKKANFITGEFGDNIVSYTPDAVRQIGLWDENFFGVQYKEADYWIRALIHNKEKSCINDTLHGIELNNEAALVLDTTVDRNFEKQLVNNGSELKRRPDDIEHREIWHTRSGQFKNYSWMYFRRKWSKTWFNEPQKEGWLKNWPIEFKNSPPDITQSKLKRVIRYFYFEKDIEDLEEKNYLL